MLKEFLTQTCNIYSVAIVTLGGEQTKTNTKIYSNIGCKLYRKKRFSLPDTGLAQETDTSTYSVIIEGDKVMVQTGNTIEVFDSLNNALGKFLVQTVFPYKTLRGKQDHLNLSITKM
jgi:hypothetical protein